MWLICGVITVASVREGNLVGTGSTVVFGLLVSFLIAGPRRWDAMRQGKLTAEGVHVRITYGSSGSAAMRFLPWSAVRSMVVWMSEEGKPQYLYVLTGGAIGAVDATADPAHERRLLEAGGQWATYPVDLRRTSLTFEDLDQVATRLSGGTVRLERQTGPAPVPGQPAWLETLMPHIWMATQAGRDLPPGAPGQPLQPGQPGPPAGSAGPWGEEPPSGAPGQPGYPAPYAGAAGPWGQPSPGVPGQPEHPEPGAAMPRYPVPHAPGNAPWGTAPGGPFQPPGQAPMKTLSFRRVGCIGCASVAGVLVGIPILAAIVRAFLPEEAVGVMFAALPGLAVLWLTRWRRSFRARAAEVPARVVADHAHPRAGQGWTRSMYVEYTDPDGVRRVNALKGMWTSKKTGRPVAWSGKVPKVGDTIDVLVERMQPDQVMPSKSSDRPLLIFWAIWAAGVLLLTFFG